MNKDLFEDSRKQRETYSELSKTCQIWENSERLWQGYLLTEEISLHRSLNDLIH